MQEIPSTYTDAPALLEAAVAAGLAALAGLPAKRPWERIVSARKSPTTWWPKGE